MTMSRERAEEVRKLVHNEEQGGTYTLITVPGVQGRIITKGVTPEEDQEIRDRWNKLIDTAPYTGWTYQDAIDSIAKEKK